MAKREYILRHLKIIQKLRFGNPVPFSEMKTYLEDQSEIHSFNLSVSQRTFQRDINEIRSIYGIDILYDSNNGGYYIDATDSNDIRDRILESFDMITSLKVVNEVNRHIRFEQRHSLGTRHFYGLLHAIRNQQIIRLTHQAFYRDEPLLYIVEPFFLKEFKGRWYLIGNEVNKKTIKTFGLDRIINFIITEKHFALPEDFNPDILFSNCFGIFNPTDSQPEEIILSFVPEQGKYIKTFPLHESQTILTDNVKELRIKLWLYITYDLMMELLSYGETLEVIAPKRLRNDLARVLQNAWRKNSG